MWGATIFRLKNHDHVRISIHAPRVGRDALDKISADYTREFQSTRPVWGATREKTRDFQAKMISIHAPRVGRDRRRQRERKEAIISIHAPRVGRDVALIDCRMGRGGISIHAPRVGRDRRAGGPVPVPEISIHAPRVGRDSKFDDFTPSNLHKRYKRVLARPKNTREKGKIKQKLAYIHAFSAFLGCEGSGTFCALVLRTQYR